MNTWLKRFGLPALLLLGVLAYAGFVGTTGQCTSCLLLPSPEPVTSPAVSDAPAPKTDAVMSALSLTLVDGSALTPDMLAGKVVLVDFWATWCSPCRQMIPGLIELQTAYGGRGFTVLGLSTDQDGAEIVRRFMAAQGINYPVALAGESSARAFGGVEYLPTSFLIDRAGKVVSRHVGFVAKADLEREIIPLLAAPEEIATRP